MGDFLAVLEEEGFHQRGRSPLTYTRKRIVSGDDMVFYEICTLHPAGGGYEVVLDCYKDRVEGLPLKEPDFTFRGRLDARGEMDQDARALREVIRTS